MSRISKGLRYSGAVLLTLATAFHSYSYLSARAIANAEDAAPFVAYFFEPVWLMPSITWLGLAVMIFLTPPKRIGIIIGAILSIQAVMMFAFMGPFPGAIVIGLSGVLILIGNLAKNSVNKVAQTLPS